MTTSSVFDGTPSVAKLREMNDVELLQRMAALCSTVDAHVKEITLRIEANSAVRPEKASPDRQQTKKLLAKLSAHDVLFSLMGDAAERG
jgi:hypothetical protein